MTQQAPLQDGTLLLLALPLLPSLYRRHPSSLHATAAACAPPLPVRACPRASAPTVRVLSSQNDCVLATAVWRRDQNWIRVRQGGDVV